MNSSGDSSDRSSVSGASTRVTRNTLWNLVGTVLPIVVAILAIPILINNIGTERFGVFAIAWALLTYFALLDLGVGQSAIRFLSEAFEEGNANATRGIFWTSVLVSGVLGCTSAVILALASPALINRAFNFPDALRDEALTGFYLLAAGIPLVIMIQTLGGVIQARHKFALYNKIQAPNSILTQTAPLMVLPFTQSLAWLIGALVAARMIGTCTFLIAALKNIEDPFKGPFIIRDRPGRFFSYNGWQAVSNVVSPLMVNADRFVIGIVSSATAVAFYVTPAEAVNRLALVAISLSRTVFPIFSSESSIEKRSVVYAKSLKHLTLLTTPVVVTAIIFAPDVLRIWVGEEFAQRSSIVLQIMAVGLLANSMATIFFALVQGIGRADVTAKFHILEFAVYVPMLWIAVSQFGIAGAAIVWSGRMILDLILLVTYVRRTNRVDREIEARERLYILVCISAGVIAVAWAMQAVSDGFFVRVAMWALILGVCALIAWRSFLTDPEKSLILSNGGKILTRFGLSGR